MLENDNHASVNKKSDIYQLTPMVDEKGLLRHRGRIGAVKEVAYGTKFPIILPKNHRVTVLLVDRYHQMFRHGNSETVVNEIRQLFEIPNLRAVVKQVSKNCQLCKLRKTRPIIPFMAKLPYARLAHHERAFTYTGVDYFGPLSVKVGRSTVKRWVALFTCLTTRAIHLEIAYSLTTASCISCVRRFVGRRGPPAEFFSDNGTNFVGAERVLRVQVERALSETFTSSATKWTFMPPGAPHMGGAWERLVQSVKAAMNDAYAEGKLDDEGLQTLIVEAERIVNTRPLTYLPLASEQAEALTPNHFLLLSSNGEKITSQKKDSHQPVDFEIRRHCLGQSWELIQKQLDIFWKRWLSEYLPVIRRQPKWFENSRSLKTGDLVLLVNGAMRNEWERGRIVRLLLNPDGGVRRAIVRIGKNEVLRPVTRLALLDVDVNRAVSEVAEIHQGETVAAKNGNLVTQSTD